MRKKKSECNFCKKTMSVIISIILVITAFNLLFAGGWVLFFPFLGFAVVSLLFGWDAVAPEHFRDWRYTWPMRPKSRHRRHK